MALLQCGVVLVAATSVLAPSHELVGPRHKLERVKPAPVYAAQQIEGYLTAAQVEYIRPGFNVTLESVQIPADRRPLVEVSFKDDLDQPLDRAGKVTPGPISLSFILAWYDAANRDYVAYTTRSVKSPITNVTAIQASTDSGGTWDDFALGRARYKFKTALPAGFDGSKTHTLGIYGRRDLRTIIEKDYVDNVLYDFRPDGGAVSEVWNAFATSTCNTCHDPLALHGGSRREVKLCVLCHNHTQSLDPDTGNVVEARVMIHKIHMGENLPSVKAGHPYQIIGNQQSVHDFSTVALPQDIRNCDTCHRASAPEGQIWYTRPSRAACGSCHDDVNWETGANHIAGPQNDDAVCARCHVPEGETEFDASIKGAHTIPTKSAQLKGLKIEIVSVSNTAPGSKPTVIFKLTNRDGSPVAPSSLNRLRFLMGGPTTDYTTYFREDGVTATASGDAWVYAFKTAAIPADAVGSWTMSADVYRNVTLNPGPATAVREAAKNPIFHFPVTDAQPVARRQVVEIDKCNVCHNVLALHGGSRFKVEECVICHNPTATATVADGGPKQGIHFKWMIHHIHTGEELTRPFAIGSTSFNEVRFPGDRRDCEKCHKPGTYGVPLPDGVLPTSTPRDFVPLWQPASAACLGCHDTVDAAAHAYVNTAPFGEACAACHGDGRDYAVAKVHAR